MPFQIGRPLSTAALIASVLAASLGCASTPTHNVRGVAPPAPPKPDPPTVGAATQSDEKLTLVGTPPIPGELHTDLAQFLDVRSASVLDIGTKEQGLLVATRLADTYQVHHVASPNGARSQRTFSREPSRGARWMGDKGSFAYLGDEGGNEQYQVFVSNAGKSPQLITDGRSRHDSLIVSRKGNAIAFSGNERNGKDMDIYVAFGRAELKPERKADVSGHFFPIEFSDDTKTLLVGEYLSINESRVHLLDTHSGKLTVVEDERAPASYRDAALSRDGNRIFVASDRDGDFVDLFVFDVKAKKWEAFGPRHSWNVEALALSPDGSSLAYVTNEEGLSRLHIASSRDGRVVDSVKFDDAIMSDLRFAPDRNVLAFTASGPSMPGDAFTYNLKTRKLERWTQSEMANLDTATLVKPKLHRFKSFDGLSVPVFMFEPNASQKRGPKSPVVVWIHGGPESQARPSFHPLIQYLATHAGYAVAVPNVRGSDGYGKRYLLLDNGEKRRDSVRDIGALLEWIAKQPSLDASKVAVLGGSYGGFMVLASLVDYGEKLRCGVDIVGISHFVTFLENTKAYRRDLRRAEYGDERDPKMRAFLNEISPVTNSKRIRSALFVAHGANDPRVPLAETDQIVEAVRASGQDTWYMVAHNEGHGFQKRENRDLFYELTALFLDRHIGAHRFAGPLEFGADSR